MREEQTSSIASLGFSAKVQQCRSFLRQELEPGLSVLQMCPVASAQCWQEPPWLLALTVLAAGAEQLSRHGIQLMTSWLLNLETL